MKLWVGKHLSQIYGVIPTCEILKNVKPIFENDNYDGDNDVDDDKNDINDDDNDNHKHKNIC